MTSLDSPQVVVERDLARRLTGLLGGPVTELRRLSGGASRETWAFNVGSHATVRPLILRRDPPASLVATLGAGRSGGMPLEARLLRAARDVGMPVPEVIASGDADPETLQTGFIVMTRVEGETIARKILRDEPYVHARSVVVDQLGVAIAKLHALDPTSIEGLGITEPLSHYREVLDTVAYPSPAFELGFRWLEANRPISPRQTIVHGDYRLGNVIIDERGLASVLDWELCHLGDPMEDLGWLCVRAWRFGGRGEVAGLGSIEQLIAGYRSAGGEADVEAVKWWMVAGTLIWGIMCISQATAHLSGSNRSVELAAIGRRVTEQEHDLMVLLGAPSGPEALSQSPDVSTPTHGVHGLPTAVLLAEAVREYLERDVMTSTSGRVQFHARVAANVLATLERELAEGPAAVASLRADHSLLGVADEADLASAIRFGLLDERRSEVVAAVRRAVTARLRIANPKHFADRME